MDITALPRVLYSGKWQASGHVQGIAVVPEKNYICYSFTTVLVKTDLQGNLIGTVGGLVGHLGCIDYNPEDGRVWGSLEYKNDAIGQGILHTLGRSEDSLAENAFYAVSFDVDKIDRVGLDAERDGIMTATYLPDVVEDYHATGEGGRPHRYACSGVDGTSFGPAFGAAPDAPRALMIAYGVYGDTERDDNDNQVILQYDWQRLAEAARPLSQAAPHHSGVRADARYFFYTGNTTYGVQNLCYASTEQQWLLSVYRGEKPQFPNYDIFVIDGSAAPRQATLTGLAGEQGLLLTAKAVGLADGQTGVRGFYFPWGTTGIHALGEGYFYISHEYSTREKPRIYSSTVHLYRYTGEENAPFVLV